MHCKHYTDSIIIIIERKDLGGVMSKDCKDTLQCYNPQQINLF